MNGAVESLERAGADLSWEINREKAKTASPWRRRLKYYFQIAVSGLSVSWREREGGRDGAYPGEDHVTLCSDVTIATKSDKMSETNKRI